MQFSVLFGLVIIYRQTSLINSDVKMENRSSPENLKKTTTTKMYTF